MRVQLIGGTSHVGKSTFAGELAENLSWNVMSTDMLARHPGRPWRDGGEVPAHVRSYFSDRSDDVLVEEVISHFHRIVWPIAEAIIRGRMDNPYDDCLVIEGSAVLPESVVGAAFDQAKANAVWLTVPDELIAERIRENSNYSSRAPKDRALVDRFLARSLAFNRHLLKAVNNLGLPALDVSDVSNWNRTLQELVIHARGT